MSEDNKSFYLKNVWDDAPVFHQPWWLDAVTDGAWDVCIIKQDEELKAYYLYAYKKGLSGYVISMPVLTQFLGPGYKLKEGSSRKRVNEETEILEALIQQLPACASFESRWHFHYQNWLPFYWKRFHQTTRYTYFFDDLSKPELLRQNFSDKINREIKKAEKEFIVEEAGDTEALYELVKINFQAKSMSVPFTKIIFDNIYRASVKESRGKILLAKDNKGKTAAGIFLIWDSITAYYLIGGKDDAFGNRGAMSLLLWKGFNELAGKVTGFDFEGSMIPGVEKYFRSFSAEQKGFFQITRISSPLLRMKDGARAVLRRK